MKPECGTKQRRHNQSWHGDQSWNHGNPGKPGWESHLRIQNQNWDYNEARTNIKYGIHVNDQSRKWNEANQTCIWKIWTKLAWTWTNNSPNHIYAHKPELRVTWGQSNMTYEGSEQRLHEHEQVTSESYICIHARKLELKSKWGRGVIRESYILVTPK